MKKKSDEKHKYKYVKQGSAESKIERNSGRSYLGI